MGVEKYLLADALSISCYRPKTSWEDMQPHCKESYNPSSCLERKDILTITDERQLFVEEEDVAIVIITGYLNRQVIRKQYL